MNDIYIRQLDAAILEINRHMDAVAMFAERLRHFPDSNLKSIRQEYVFARQNWLAEQARIIFNKKIDLGYW